MRLVLPHIFLFGKNVVIVKIQTFLTILLWNYFEGIDYDQTIPHQRVDISLQQSPLQLSQYLRSIDDVHLDQVSLKGIGFSAFFDLVGTSFEGRAILKHDCNSGIRLICGQRYDSFDDATLVNVTISLIRLIDPASRVLLDPGNIEILFLIISPVCVHIIYEIQTKQSQYSPSLNLII